MTKEAKRIVAALRVVCDERSCEDCPCYDWCHMRKVNCLDDAAANMIESLSAQLDQVTRERDAAVEDMILGRICATCRDYNNPATSKCAGCLSWHSNWRWRGAEVKV